MKIENLGRKVEEFLTNTSDARALSELCRDFYDGKQWAEKEKKVLIGRGQAPIINNRIKPKVEGLVGLYNMRRSDPKAYARTSKHEQSSHVVTDGLRFVADNNDFDSIKAEIANEFFVEGYSGAIVDVKEQKTQNGDEIIIRIAHIPWDRIYFQTNSRKKDFSDARWKGMVIWMDVDEAKEKFPDIDIDQCVLDQGQIDETFEDRPRWVDNDTNRIRIALHYEIFGGVWHMAIACGDIFLFKPQVSPLLDDDGNPTCPIELVGAFVDRDNNRYSETAGFLDQQREINSRRSKFLHYLNQKQSYGRKGADADIQAIKREKQKPDGHIEFVGDEFGKDFGFLPNDGAEQGQFLLYQDAKAELDAVSINAQLAGQRQQGDLSGVAIGKLQQAGTIELNRQYSLLATFEKRVYKQIFARIKQFWTAEKWIRVTDDQDNLRWVGFNTEVTMQEALEEKINDESEPLHVRKFAAEAYTQLLQAQDPRLQQIVEVRNALPELEMDIIIDQSFDAINADEEQFKILAQFANGKDVDVLDLIELSQLRGKDELIEKIEKRRQAASEAAGGAAQLEAASTQAKTENTQADTVKKFTEAQQKQLENDIIVSSPERVTNVSI